MVMFSGLIPIPHLPFFNDCQTEFYGTFRR